MGSFNWNEKFSVSNSSSTKDIVFDGFVSVVVMFFSIRSSSRKNNFNWKFRVVKFLFLTLTSISTFSVGFHIQFISLVCDGSIISIISSSSSETVSSQSSYAVVSGKSVKNNRVKSIMSLFFISFYGLELI